MSPRAISTVMGDPPIFATPSCTKELRADLRFLKVSHSFASLIRSVLCGWELYRHYCRRARQELTVALGIHRTPLTVNIRGRATQKPVKHSAQRQRRQA